MAYLEHNACEAFSGLNSLPQGASGTLFSRPTQQIESLGKERFDAMFRSILKELNLFGPGVFPMQN